MPTVTKVPRDYVATTADGRYGLAAPTETSYGFYGLYRIVPETTDDWDDEMVRLVGPYADYWVGDVSNPENIETAADAADEEMSYLIADAREEFGL
jgi:hypothetical protein